MSNQNETLTLNLDKCPIEARVKEKIKINPTDIPDADYQTACRILSYSVRRAFENPRVRQEYELWKAEKEARKAAKQVP